MLLPRRPVLAQRNELGEVVAPEAAVVQVSPVDAMADGSIYFEILENYRVDNLWIKFTSPKKEFRLPNFLHEEEISKLLDHLNKNSNSHKKVCFRVYASD